MLNQAKKKRKWKRKKWK